MQKNHQAKILTAMMHADFYPHPVESIERRETHISTVVLTGPVVYKLKKPVNLGFLDFSSLEKRRRCCVQEVTLNRRLSDGIYLDTVPITLDGGTYRLDGPGAKVEFAVKMHQLADADSMQQRLQQTGLDDWRIDALVRKLVGFYRQAARETETDIAGNPAWEENLQLAEQFIGVWIDGRQFEFVRSATRAFYRQHPPLFERRNKEGKIRDCHGDLRTDHIYFTRNGIQIIDCIEFDDRLRYLDIINDLAFLAMDLAYNHFPDASRRLIRAYVEQTGDINALPLLDFYRCYRAMVRCKVSCFRLKETGNQSLEHKALLGAADNYLAMAHAYAAAFNQPTLWLVCGLPASGKSTIAAALAETFAITVIRSDVIRKRLFEGPSGEFERGLYSSYATETTYNQMFLLAQEQLKKGLGVVIDATFSRSSQRVEALRVAAYHQARPVFIACSAAEAVLAARLLKRETEPSLSDARLIHLEAFKKRFDPMTRIGNEIHLRVDTENPPSVCLRQILLSNPLLDG